MRLDKKNSAWTFLTNHTHVLFVLATAQDIVLREVAFQVGITERAVQRILSELEGEGFVEIEKKGRKNKYKLSLNKPLRHPLEKNHTIGDIIGLLKKSNS